MIVLFIVLVIFSVGLPVALEERRHRGDNILKGAGKDILESAPVRRLVGAYANTVSSAKAMIASALSLTFTLFVVIIALELLFKVLSAVFSK